VLSALIQKIYFSKKSCLVAYGHILRSLTNCRYVTKRHVKSESTFCVYDILQTSWYPHAIYSDCSFVIRCNADCWRHVK